jgi:SNF2 family DNA or RNA helicase
MIEPLWPNMTYFPHQLHGIQWMLEKELVGTRVGGSGSGGSSGVVRGGFQCDDMGLGKTIQTTAVICTNRLARTLLVVPMAMIETWTDVCRRAGILVFEIAGGLGEWTCRNHRTANRFGGERPAVYITNFEKVAARPSLFIRRWDRVVVDEAHKLANPYSNVSYGMRQIQGEVRWVLTGTPVVNSLRDMASLGAFLGIPTDPGYRWSKTMTRVVPSMMLHRTLDELRRCSEEAGGGWGVPPVPQIEECVLPFATEKEEEFYHGVQTAVEEKLAAGSYYGKLSAVHKMVLLLRLRQISVHPQTYWKALGESEDWVEPSTKMRKVADIIRADGDGDGGRVHKYLIFCQFHHEMELFQEYLVMEGLARPEAVLMYHGGMTAGQRREVLLESKALTETTAMMVQLQAGGVGLNLQEYDRVIFMGPWWTAALMDQALARAVRMGQREVVKVYHLLLAAEKENSVNIDLLVRGKAEGKRMMLLELFQWCGREAPEGCAMEPPMGAEAEAEAEEAEEAEAAEAEAAEAEVDQ